MVPWNLQVAGPLGGEHGGNNPIDFGRRNNRVIQDRLRHRQIPEDFKLRVEVFDAVVQHRAISTLRKTRCAGHNE